MSKYWLFECEGRNCSLRCSVAIDDMPVPEFHEGYCWIDGGTKEIWKLVEVCE